MIFIRNIQCRNFFNYPIEGETNIQVFVMVYFTNYFNYRLFHFLLFFLILLYENRFLIHLYYASKRKSTNIKENTYAGTL